MKPEPELELKRHAIDKAIKIYEEIKNACSKPDKCITGETLSIYKELADWGFFDNYSIIDPNNKKLYIMVLSMHLCENYEEKSVEDKNTKGRWEIIQAAIKRNDKGITGKKKDEKI